MIKILLIIVGLMASIGIRAADIYGLSERDTTNIMKKYGKEIADFEAAFQKEALKHPYSESDNTPDNNTDTPSQKKLKNKRLALIKKITNDNGFLFVDLDIVFYPEDNKTYMTIEVVDKQHPERLRFLNDAKKNEYTAKKRAHKQDIVEEMITYNNEGFALLLAHKVSSFSSDCPVYHCGVGFKHPKLKPYLAKFNTGAVQERGFIIDTLNHDPDPERRAAAVFLIGHFLDPHEIISLLSSHISDKDEDVRNNVMRVIATTMVKAKINTIDVMPFLDALDSPYATDRNKALYVLFVASNDKKSQGVILQKGGAKLLALARLKQPNNHYWAYGILKKISGQDFGPTNIVAWSAWVSSAKKQSA